MVSFSLNDLPQYIKYINKMAIFRVAWAEGVDDFIILKSYIIYSCFCLSAIYFCLVVLNYQEPELIFPLNGPQSQHFIKKIQIKYLEKQVKSISNFSFPNLAF